MAGAGGSLPKAKRAYAVALIKRLKKACAPSRELEESIYFDVVGERRPPKHPCKTCGTWSIKFAPAYMSSLADALKLLPEGWQAILYTESNTAELYNATLKRREGVDGIKVREQGCTLATAVCIAAIKIRAALSKSKGG